MTVYNIDRLSEKVKILTCFQKRHSYQMQYWLEEFERFSVTCITGSVFQYSADRVQSWPEADGVPTFGDID